MEIPSKVTIFNRTLELKGKQATIIAISKDGYYEITMEFQGRTHTVLFPIQETTVIFNDAIPSLGGEFEVER
jgi:hypothetical protein